MTYDVSEQEVDVSEQEVGMKEATVAPLEEGTNHQGQPVEAGSCPQRSTTGEQSVAKSWLQDPFGRYCQVSYDRPGRTFVLAFLPFFVMTAILIGGGFAEMSEGQNWLVSDHPAVLSMYSHAAAKTFVFGDAGEQVPQQTKRMRRMDLYFIYKSRSGAADLLSREKMRKIAEIERRLVSMLTYTDYCLLDDDRACRAPISVTNLFSQPELDDDVKFDVKARALPGREDAAFFFDENFAKNRNATYIRSLFTFGGPLKGFKSEEDDESEQRKRRTAFTKEVDDMYKDYFGLEKPHPFSTEHMVKAEADGMEIIWFSDQLTNVESTHVVNNDFKWALASILFGFLYITVHTKSFLLATLAMLEVVFSYSTAWFIYRCIFQVTFFSQFHILVVFLMLGLGPDDVFVFVDAFKQAEHELSRVGEACTPERRVSFTARRASKAILITSFTTMMAFVATAFSEIMPICSFGIFAAIMVCVLFTVNCLWLPPVLALWASRYEQQAFCRCCCCTAVLPEPPTKGENGEKSDTKEQLRWLERMFGGPFVDSLNKWPVKGPAMILFATLLGIGLWKTQELEPPSKQESFWPDEHLFSRFERAQSEFASSAEDETATVTLFWGVKGLDRSDVSKWDSDAFGVAIWDESFDLPKPESQQFLLDKCNSLKQVECAKCRRGLLVRATRQNVPDDNPVKCWAQHFQSWLVTTQNRTFPVPEPEFMTLLKLFLRSPAALGMQQQLGIVDGKVLFTSVEVDSALREGVPRDTSATAKDVYNEFVSLVTKWNGEAPRWIEGARFEYFWFSWLPSEQALVDNAYQGMMLCFVLAFIVLVFSTMNLLVAFLSTLSIAGIVCTVLGVFVNVVKGWAFGISESIAAVVLIGFSMDYVVHFANAYTEAQQAVGASTRFARAQYALRSMGISVVAGSITTFGSGCMLWGATHIFFTKFAFLICTTIFSSLMWSMLFFMPVLLICGPERDQFDLHGLFRRVKGQCAGNKAGTPGDG